MLRIGGLINHGDMGRDKSIDFLNHSLSALMSAVTYIGQHTMPILIFHFLAFKMANYVGVLCLGDPVEMIASFPTAYRGIWWAVVYTLVGVALPLELNALYVKSKRCMLCC